MNNSFQKLKQIYQIYYTYYIRINSLLNTLNLLISSGCGLLLIGNQINKIIPVLLFINVIIKIIQINTKIMEFATKIKYTLELLEKPEENLNVILKIAPRFACLNIIFESLESQNNIDNIL